VVGVRVGIDDDLDRLRAHTRDGRLDLGAHLRNGSVHEQNAVVTDEDNRITALPVQQVNTMASAAAIRSRLTGFPSVLNR
jgi:hypothetical protein